MNQVIPANTCIINRLPSLRSLFKTLAFDHVAVGSRVLVPVAGSPAKQKHRGWILVPENVPKYQSRNRLSVFSLGLRWSLQNGLLRVLILKDLLREKCGQNVPYKHHIMHPSVPCQLADIR